MIGKVWDSQKIIGDELVLRVLFFSWRQWLKNLISEKRLTFFYDYVNFLMPDAAQADTSFED